MGTERLTTAPQYFHPEWRDERNIRGGTIVLQTNRMHVADERRAQVEGAEIIDDRSFVSHYSNQVETV
jgi:hypothetical protein